jgi:hypothetical protein
MAEFIVQQYRDTELRYQTIFDPLQSLWFAWGYVRSIKKRSRDTRAYTTPGMAREVEAKELFYQWAIQWIDENP